MRRLREITSAWFNLSPWQESIEAEMLEEKRIMHDW